MYWSGKFILTRIPFPVSQLARPSGKLSRDGSNMLAKKVKFTQKRANSHDLCIVARPGHDIFSGHCL